MSDKPNSQPNTRGKTSRSKRLKLLFPVHRVRRFLRNGNYTNRIGRNAPVALAVVIEYLISELLKISGEIARKLNVRRITPHHLLLAIRMDDDLNKLLSQTTIVQGGVLPEFLNEN